MTDKMENQARLKANIKAFEEDEMIGFTHDEETHKKYREWIKQLGCDPDIYLKFKKNSMETAKCIAADINQAVERIVSLTNNEAGKREKKNGKQK